MAKDWSSLLLQSRSTIDLIRRHFRAIILYDYKKGLTAVECFTSLTEAFGGFAPSRGTVGNWFRKFRMRRKSLHGEKFNRTVELAVRKPLFFALLWRPFWNWGTGYPKLTKKLARERLVQVFRVTARIVWGNGSPKLTELFDETEIVQLSVCLAHQFDMLGERIHQTFLCLEDEPHAGRSHTALTNENLATVHKLFTEWQNFTYCGIKVTLEIRLIAINTILYDYSRVKKLYSIGTPQFNWGVKESK